MFVVLWILVGGICSAGLAQSRNRSVGGWFVVGMLLGPIGILLAACMPKLEVGAPAKAEPVLPLTDADRPRRPCPHCAEAILVGARVCRFCNHDLASGWDRVAS